MYFFGRGVVHEGEAEDAVIVRVDAESLEKAHGVEIAARGHDAVAGEAAAGRPV